MCSKHIRSCVHFSVSLLRSLLLLPLLVQSLPRTTTTTTTTTKQMAKRKQQHGRCKCISFNIYFHKTFYFISYALKYKIYCVLYASWMRFCFCNSVAFVHIRWRSRYMCLLFSLSISLSLPSSRRPPHIYINMVRLWVSIVHFGESMCAWTHLCYGLSISI